MTVSSAPACCGVTPGFSLPTTLSRPRRSVALPAARSGSIGSQTSVRDSGSAARRIDAAAYGNWNASGITPTMVRG